MGRIVVWVSSAFCVCVITSVVSLGVARLSHLSRSSSARAILRCRLRAGIEEMYALSFVISIT